MWTCGHAPVLKSTMHTGHGRLESLLHAAGELLSSDLSAPHLRPSMCAQHRHRINKSFHALAVRFLDLVCNTSEELQHRPPSLLNLRCLPGAAPQAIHPLAGLSPFNCSIRTSTCVGTTRKRTPVCLNS